MFPGDEIFHTGFWVLRTEAHNTSNSIGPIPWSKCRQYAKEALQLADHLLEPYWYVIREMDGELASWMKNEYDRERKHQRSDSKKAAVTSRGRYDRATAEG